jgi:deazaflavin-dependent oxidoreductase (nitroreductase family)
MDAQTQRVLEQFRAGGEVDGMHRDRLLLLTTTGRRSGQPRTTPVMRFRIGSMTYAVASANGSPTDPEWLRNLEADPHAHVEEDGAEYDATARILRGTARATVWPAILEIAPFFTEHEQRAGREIPVVEFIPAAS